MIPYAFSSVIKQLQAVMALEAQGESIIELARLVIKCKPHHIFRKKQEVRIFLCENLGRVAENREDFKI